MASRKRATAPDHDCIRTSVTLARGTHARLNALASLRGCTVNALLVEAAEQVVRGIVVMDRRKPADRGASPGLVRESASAAVDLDDPEESGDRQAA